MVEGGQVGNAHIDHIDFAVIFSVSFITYQKRNIVVVFLFDKRAWGWFLKFAFI